MDKGQTLQSFWSSFEWDAYDENTVPDDAQLPYITYSVSIGNIDNPVLLSASLWDRSTSWKNVSNKADEIANDIGYGGKTIKIDGGYLYISLGSPFAQRMADPSDGSAIRRIYLNLDAEFLTAT